MRGRGELRWLVGTVVIVAVLLGISALALDRPNVVWEKGRPHCPACRADVSFYSVRCPECGTDFDWTVAPGDESPVAPEALSPLEEEALRDRVAALGKEEAIRRIAKALSIPEESAADWLDSIARGRCGYCGGTGLDLATVEGRDECPLCFGRGACIASGEDRLVRVGDVEAARAFDEYETALAELKPGLPPEIRTREARRATRRFLERHAGTTEAGRVRWWPDVAAGKPPRRAANMGRELLDRVLDALAAEAQ